MITQGSPILVLAQQKKLLFEPSLHTYALLPYRFANGKEVPGLVVELDDDLNGNVEMRVLLNANVVSAVTLATLRHGESRA